MLTVIELSFSYQPGEYARAIRRLQVRKLRATFDSMIALMMIAVGITLWTSEGFSFWAGILTGGGVIFLGMLGFAVFVIPVLIERGEPKLREPYSLSFSPERIHFRTPSVESNLSWNMYSSWFEDSEFLYLLHGKRNVSVIPYRACPDAEGRRLLRDLASRHISGSRGVA